MNAFRKTKTDNTTDGSQVDQTLMTALTDLEERLRGEFQESADAMAQRLYALEKRLDKLEKKHDIEARSSDSLEDRVMSLEGILKKAEEAGKRRRGRATVGTAATAAASAASGATPTMTRQRSRSRGVARTLSNGRMVTEKKTDSNVDAAGNPVVAVTDDDTDEE